MSEALLEEYLGIKKDEEEAFGSTTPFSNIDGDEFESGDESESDEEEEFRPRRRFRHDEVDLLLKKVKQKKFYKMPNSKRKTSDTGSVDNDDNRGKFVSDRREVAKFIWDEQQENPKEEGAWKFLRQRALKRFQGTRPADEGSPRYIIPEKIASNRHNERYQRALQNLSGAWPTSDQIATLQKAIKEGPNYLGRTASLKGGSSWPRATNGFTAQNLMMPAADTHYNQALHTNLHDLTKGELCYMTGQHLMWNDIPGDEFLSYSIDPLFLVTHALNRLHLNQGNVTIQFLDRRTAESIKREPVEFHHALTIYETFDVPGWTGWGTMSKDKLRSRKFTHEYLSNGTIRVRDSRFQQAPIEKLIEDGLHEIFPAFEVPENHKRAGLYVGQVAFRRIGYPPNARAKSEGHAYSYENCKEQTPFTLDILEKVQKLCQNFMAEPEYRWEQKSEPHLHIFLSFLTFQKRPKLDPVFYDWIQSHYMPADVIDLYDDGNGGVRKGYTHVASNLPGVMQYLDLIRDAQVALGLRELDPTKVESNNCLTGEVYTEEDVRLQKKAVAFHRHKVDMAPKACKVTKDGERGNVGLPSPLYMMAGALSSGSDISDEGISVPKAETALGISASQSDHEEYWAGHGEYGWYVDDNDADVDNGGLYLPSRVGDRRDSDAADFEGASEEEEESSPTPSF